MKANKKILTLILSFFIPFFITLAALAALGVTPFGNKMLVFGDAYSYYIPWKSYFRTVLSGDHSMFYSFSDGIGANVSFYASTELLKPDILLFLLAGWDYIPEMFTLDVLIDTSICGLTMYIFLSGMLGAKASHLIFSTSYAMMGFMVMNNYNTLFHIAPAMLPLMALGLLRLIKEKKVLLYILSLAYAIVTGIQMGFILCTASVIFFGAYIYVNYSDIFENKRNLFLRYGISSILAGFLGSFMWMPSLVSAKDRASMTSLENYLFEDNGPILQMASKLYSGAASTYELMNGYPMIFCGILPIALLVLFFANTKITKRKRWVFLPCFWSIF